MTGLSYTFDELMSEPAIEEPLIAGGVRCHGGYVGGAIRVAAQRGAATRDRCVAATAGRRGPAAGSRARQVRAAELPELSPGEIPAARKVSSNR